MMQVVMKRFWKRTASSVHSVVYNKGSNCNSYSRVSALRRSESFDNDKYDKNTYMKQKWFASSSRFKSPSQLLLPNQGNTCLDLSCRESFHTSAVATRSDSTNIVPEATSAPTSVFPPDQNAQSCETLVETWFYTVSPRGSLHLNLPFKTIVRPLNPQKYPDMDKVIIEVHFDKTEVGEVPSSHELSHLADLYSLDVTFDEDVARMNIAGKVTAGVSIPLVCMLWIPLQSDLYATVPAAKDLIVEKLESNSLNITMESGDCYLKSLKTGSVNVQSRGGNIISRSTLLGNTVFHTGMAGRIEADKLQGSSIVCETEMGSVAVKSLYVETGMVRTTGGAVRLGQCHGQLLVQASQADIHVGSLEGDIDVGMQDGDVNVHLSRHSQSNIDVKNGNISLSFPEDANTDLSLDSREVSVEDSTAVTFVDTDVPHHREGYIGEQGKATVHARTLSGRIEVKFLDWIQTTNLTFWKHSDT